MLREHSRKDDVLYYLGSAAIGLLGALAMIFLAGPANAQDRPDFSGTWKLNATASRIKDPKLATDCSKLTISQKDGSISLAEANGSPLECSTAGKECPRKDSKVSFWFNGAKLVEMEHLGRAEHIRKRRLSLSADGKTMQMEVIPITPAGETSLLAFEKAQ